MDSNIIYHRGKMDINQYYLNRIANSSISHWRTRQMIKKINEEISGYRLLAMHSKGYIRDFSNREANRLESLLRISMSRKKV